MTANVPPKNLLYTLRLTGRERSISPEHGASYSLREAEVVQTYETSHADSFDGVCELDGKYFYLVESEWEYDGPAVAEGISIAACLLVEKRWGEDYGGNVWDERVAPESTAGITHCGPGGRKPPQRPGHSEPLFAVVPPSLDFARQEKAEHARRVAEAREAVAEYQVKLAAWRTAWATRTAEKEAMLAANEPVLNYTPSHNEVARTADEARAAEDLAAKKCGAAMVQFPRENWFTS